MHYPIPLLLGALSLTLFNPVIADDDGWEQGHNYTLKGPGSVHYRRECGSCHIAYPPRFLQDSSWEKVMDELDNHFGDNTELDPKEHQMILDYLVDHSGSSRWYQFWQRHDEKSIPTRIIDTRAFRHEHDELPKKFYAENFRQITLSQCDQCHPEAAQGRFDEHQIRIPGMGQWYDD